MMNEALKIAIKAVDDKKGIDVVALDITEVASPRPRASSITRHRSALLAQPGSHSRANRSSGVVIVTPTETSRRTASRSISASPSRPSTSR